MDSVTQLEATASKFDRDLRSMGDDWSKYNGPEVRCGFEAEFASSVDHYEFADKLHVALGINRSSVTVNPTYGASHSGDYRYWSVETDSTIEIDSMHNTRIELVSPIMGLDAMLASMSKTFDLLDSVGRTNASTGLHMTFSLKDIDLSKVNVAKLALLLGEEYWASAFDREDTTYAVAVLPMISELLEQPIAKAMLSAKQFDTRAFLDAIRNLETNPKYRTINASKILDRDEDTQCVELRLPGGPNYHKKFSLCSRIARRFAYALYASTCSAYDDVFALKVYRLAAKQREQQDQEFGDALTVRIVEAAKGYRIVTKRGQGKYRPFAEISVFAGSVTRLGLAPNCIEPLSDRAAQDIAEFATKISGSGMTVHGKNIRLAWKDADEIDWRTIRATFQPIRPTISLLQLCGITSKSDIAQYLIYCAERNKYYMIERLIDPLGYLHDPKDDAHYAVHAGYWVSRVAGGTDAKIAQEVLEALKEVSGNRKAKFCAGAGIAYPDLNATFITELSTALANQSNYNVLDPNLIPSLLATLLNGMDSDIKMCLDIIAEIHPNLLVDVDDIAARFTSLIPTVSREYLDMSQTVASIGLSAIRSIVSLKACAQSKRLRDALVRGIIHALQGVGYSIRPNSNLLAIPASDEELRLLGATDLPELLPEDADEEHIEGVLDCLSGIDNGLDIDKYSRDSLRRALDNRKLIAHIQTPRALRDEEQMMTLIGHWFDASGWESAQPNFLNLLKSSGHYANTLIHSANYEDRHSDVDRMNYRDVVDIVRTAFRKGESEFIGQTLGDKLNRTIEFLLARYMRSALQRGNTPYRGSIHLARALLNDISKEALAKWIADGVLRLSTFHTTDDLLERVAVVLAESKEQSIPLDHHYDFLDYVAALQREKQAGTHYETIYNGSVAQIAQDYGITIREAAVPRVPVPVYAPAVDSHKLGDASRPDNFVPQALPLEEILASLDDSTFFAVIPEDGVSTQETAEARQERLLAAIDSASEADIKTIYDHVDTKLSVSMRKLFYLLIIHSGVASSDMSNPAVYKIGINYPDFVDQLFSTIHRIMAHTDTIPSMFGYSPKDAVYLLLTQTTAAPTNMPLIGSYFSMLSYMAGTVGPDIVFSARSVLYLKKLRGLGFALTKENSRNCTLLISRELDRFHCKLEQNKNYPLLLALAKYADMTRQDYNSTFASVYA